MNTCVRSDVYICIHLYRDYTHSLTQMHTQFDIYIILEMKRTIVLQSALRRLIRSLKTKYKGKNTNNYHNLSKKPKMLHDQ